MPWSRAENQRTVADAERAMKKMGKKLVFEKCTIGLDVIDAYLTPAENEGKLSGACEALGCYGARKDKKLLYYFGNGSNQSVHIIPCCVERRGLAT
jgi:hypothetical protein